MNDWLKARLSEKSTWAGAAVLAAQMLKAAGVDPSILDTVSALAGAAAMGLAEKGSPDQAK